MRTSWAPFSSDVAADWTSSSIKTAAVVVVGHTLLLCAGVQTM